MKIDHLLYFYETSRRKSLNESSKYLHLSQQSLSASIRSLEEELGVQLFRRTNNGILITDVGKKALEHIEVIIEEYRNLLALKNSGEETCDPVIILAQRSLSKIFLSPELIEYVKTSKLIIHSGAVEDKILDAECDGNDSRLCLRFYPKEMLSLIVRKAEEKGKRILSLASGSISLFVNSRLPLAKKKHVLLSDLDGLSFATSGRALRRIYDYNNIFMQKASIKKSVVFPDRQTLFDAIAKSQNIYTVSLRLDAFDNLLIRQKVITAREIDDASIPLVFCLVIPSNRKLNALEEEIVALVKKQFAQMESSSIL